MNTEKREGGFGTRQWMKAARILKGMLSKPKLPWTDYTWKSGRGSLLYSGRELSNILTFYKEKAGNVPSDLSDSKVKKWIPNQVQTQGTART